MMKQDLRPYADCYNVESVYHSGYDTETYPELDIDALLIDDCIDAQEDIYPDLEADDYADAIMADLGLSSDAALFGIIN